jgi:hypothetical protein
VLAAHRRLEAWGRAGHAASAQQLGCDAQGRGSSVKRDVAATALDVNAVGRAASGQRRRDEGGTTRRWPGLGRGRGKGQARCASGARLLRRRGCARGACTPGQWTCCVLRATTAGRGLAGERRMARRGAARTQRTHTVGERMGKGREDGASSPRRTNGGAPAVIHGEVVTRGGDGGRETAQKIPDGSVLVTSWARKLRRAVLGKMYSAPCAWAYEQRRRRSTRACWAR